MRVGAGLIAANSCIDNVENGQFHDGNQVFNDLLMQSAKNYVSDSFRNDKSLNWWHRTIGTQYHKAQVSPLFKRVFDAGQSFLQDTSQIAMNAADLAPGLLLKLGNLKDILDTANDLVHPGAHQGAHGGRLESGVPGHPH